MANARHLKSPEKETGEFTVKTAAFTLKDSDSGTLFKWNSATSFNFTLPPVGKASKGVHFDFVVMTAASGGVGHGVSPNSADTVFIPGASNADDKDIYFATASDVVGDGFRLVSDGVNGWHVKFVTGLVIKES